jgi:hypothetical protein
VNKGSAADIIDRLDPGVLIDQDFLGIAKTQMIDYLRHLNQIAFNVFGLNNHAGERPLVWHQAECTQSTGKTGAALGREHTFALSAGGDNESAAPAT